MQNTLIGFFGGISRRLGGRLGTCIALIGILSLSACGNAPGNMTHEVGGWFNTSKGAPQNPATAEPQAAPTIPVQAAPMDTTPNGQHGAPAKVAILLPLTGEKAGMGKSFLAAAQLAVMDMGGQGFELTPKDSGADPAMAGRAAAEAVQEGAQMIIGPLFSTSIGPVKAAAPNLPILALSNDWEKAGGNVFVLGFNPAEQVRRIAAFAASRGITNIAVLAPATTYGDVALSTLNEGNSPVHVVLAEKYQKNKESMAKAVEAIAARTDVQGIVIPEGGAALAAIAEALRNKNITARTMPLFGTGLWDEQDVSKNSTLLGGFYAAPDPAARANFVERYARGNNNAKPQRLATLGYDATALAAVLASKGQGFNEQAITSPAGFSGLDGIFRLTSAHIAERGLAVMEVSPAGTKVVAPAPARF